MTYSWTNWSGTQQCAVAEYTQPHSIDDVRCAITRARDRGATVRAVGAGHSFSPVAVTEGVQLQLDHLQGLINITDQTATFWAGTRLRDIPALLSPFGKALANQGDVDPQSLAGAISTGTHGTGVNFTGFAGMVRSFDLIAADGEMYHCSQTADGRAGDLFNLARLGLGAFGIITQVELDVVDEFCLYATEAPEPFSTIAAEFSQRVHDTDHLEFFWFPGTTKALVKNHRRIPNIDYRSGGLTG